MSQQKQNTMKKTSAATQPQGRATFSSAIAEANNYFRWIAAKAEPYIGSTVLEVGIGHGSLREFLPPTVNQYIGVDIDDQLVREAKQRHPDDLYFCQDITSASFAPKIYDRALVDTILCVNVLEHIKKDHAALANLLASLASGGHLFLLVPAFPQLFSEMDALAGHHKRYTKTDIKELAHGLPCRIVDQYYFNAIGGLGWWVNKFQKPQSLNDPYINRQIYMYDRYVIPVAKYMDALFYPFFGQSLITILKKK